MLFQANLLASTEKIKIKARKKNINNTINLSWHKTKSTTKSMTYKSSNTKNSNILPHTSSSLEMEQAYSQ